MLGIRSLPAAQRFLSSTSTPIKVMCITGPVGSGFHETAVSLAQGVNGEVINADSLRLFRGAPIATGMPREEMLNIIPHHLLEINDPLTLDWEQRHLPAMVEMAIREVASRGKVPIVSGGSGMMYTDLLRGPSDVPPIPDLESRAYVDQVVSAGWDAAFSELCGVDPEYARVVQGGSRDYVRVAKALDVFRRTGRPLSSFKSPLPGSRRHEFDFRCMFVSLPKKMEWRLSDAHVENAVVSGILHETLDLYRTGVTSRNSLGKAVGVRDSMNYLCGAPLAPARMSDRVALFRQYLSGYMTSVRQMSRKQKNWFLRRMPEFFFSSRRTRSITQQSVEYTYKAFECDEDLFKERYIPHIHPLWESVENNHPPVIVPRTLGDLAAIQGSATGRGGLATVIGLDPVVACSSSRSDLPSKGDRSSFNYRPRFEFLASEANQSAMLTSLAQHASATGMGDVLRFPHHPHLVYGEPLPRNTPPSKALVPPVVKPHKVKKEFLNAVPPPTIPSLRGPGRRMMSSSAPGTGGELSGLLRMTTKKSARRKRKVEGSGQGGEQPIHLKLQSLAKERLSAMEQEGVPSASEASGASFGDFSAYVDPLKPKRKRGKKKSKIISPEDALYTVGGLPGDVSTTNPNTPEGWLARYSASAKARSQAHGGGRVFDFEADEYMPDHVFVPKRGGRPVHGMEGIDKSLPAEGHDPDPEDLTKEFDQSPSATHGMLARMAELYTRDKGAHTRTHGRTVAPVLEKVTPGYIKEGWTPEQKREFAQRGSHLGTDGAPSPSLGPSLDPFNTGQRAFMVGGGSGAHNSDYSNGN